MTPSELSLFSTVSYQGTIAVIIKIKESGVMLYGSAMGWFNSYPIPASELTLVSRFTPPGGTPSSLENAPLYSKAYVDGKLGYIVDKIETLNQWTNEIYRVALVYFQDAENWSWYEVTQVAFIGENQPDTIPVEPDTIPVELYPVPNGGNHETNWSGLVKWGAILGIGYFLLIGREKPKAPTAQYVD